MNLSTYHYQSMSQFDFSAAAHVEFNGGLNTSLALNGISDQFYFDNQGQIQQIPTFQIQTKPPGIILGEKAADLSRYIWKTTCENITYLKDKTCPIINSWLEFVRPMCPDGGGITITPMREGNAQPTQGIAVALKDFSTVVPAHEFCENMGPIITDYINKNGEALSPNEPQTAEPFLGIWHNPDDAKVYLDVSVVFQPDQLPSAIELGQKENQIAIYNISTQETINTGGTGEQSSI